MRLIRCVTAWHSKKRNSGHPVLHQFHSRGQSSHICYPVCLTAGVDSATEVYGYLRSLCGFLKKNRVELTEVTHPCCWVSLLFGEQDDDMMEALKALLSIFLHHRYNRFTDTSKGRSVLIGSGLMDDSVSRVCVDLFQSLSKQPQNLFLTCKQTFFFVDLTNYCGQRISSM